MKRNQNLWATMIALLTVGCMGAGQVRIGHFPVTIQEVYEISLKPGETYDFSSLNYTIDDGWVSLNAPSANLTAIGGTDLTVDAPASGRATPGFE